MNRATVLEVLMTGIFFAGCGYGAAFGEYEYKISYERKPLEIANGCAHYDMDTGKFTWGPRPLTLTMYPVPDLDPSIGEHRDGTFPIPQRKPKAKQ